MKLLCLFTFFTALSFSQTAPPADYGFPLSLHSSWVYKGEMKLTENPVATNLEMRSDVIDVFTREGVRAAWITGSPLGLMNKIEGDHVIARVGNRVYLAEPPRSAAVLARLQNPDDELKGLFTESETLYSFPIKPGPQGCTGQAASQSCWVASPSGEASDKGFRFTWTEPKGVRIISFEPGIGISGFEFTWPSLKESAKLKLLQHDVRNE